MADDNVRDIRLHPGYSFQGDPPEDESFDLFAQLEKDGDPSLVPPPIPQPPPLPQSGNSICAQCEHVVDFRPWWKRWFVAPKVEDLFCGMSEKVQITHPVTGEVAYVTRQEAVTSNADPFPLVRCFFVNLTGSCRLFRVKMARSRRRRSE